MKKNIPLHPWLLAIAPILGLFQHNQDVASPHYLTQPIVVSLIATTIFFIILNLFLKNKTKSGIITSITVTTFFLFHIFRATFLDLTYILRNGPRQHEIFAFVIYLLFIVAVSGLIIAAKKDLRKINQLFNFFALVVVLMQVGSIVTFQYQHQTDDVTFQRYNVEDLSINNEIDAAALPDIYYIISDGYGRQDMLSEIYDYDNSDFIKKLRDIGFYVADKTSSNYNQTYLSMTSSLNLNYVDELMPELKSDEIDPGRTALRGLIKDHFVYDFLKSQGYTVVAVPNTWEGGYENQKGDINFQISAKQNNFNKILIKRTPLQLIAPSVGAKAYAEYTLEMLNAVPQIADIEAPTFTYIHLLSTHPPFVFAQDGSVLNQSMNCMPPTDGNHYFSICPGEEKYRKEYIDQMVYMNYELEKLINELIARSEVPPIIILQGDHGPGSMLDWGSLENTNLQERMSILNAYYVPEQTKEVLYPEITPVNSFRVIFNSVFGADLGTIEDKSYFATWYEPYNFTEITDLIK